MMKWDISLFKTYWDENDIKEVTNVIKRGSFWATGPEIDNLEFCLADYISRKYAVVFNSGTSALHANLLAHNITSGEVIVPSFTFISTANAVVLAGADPVFAEVEEESFGLSAEDVKDKITSKTKAIMPIHYGGMPCKEIKAIKEIADDNKLILIEDAAESLGSKIESKMVGSFGNSAMFSFCQNKIITAGEGGVIVTDSKPVFEKMKLIRSHGRLENKEGFFNTTEPLDYVDVGYNYRMSSISASLVLSQFKKIKKIIDMRRKIGEHYSKKFENIKEISLPLDSKEYFNVYQMYTIKLKDQKTRDKIKKTLEENKIMSKIYFDPIHHKTFFKKKYNYKDNDLPKTVELSNKVLTLPMYPTLEEKQVDKITNIVKNCL